MRVVPVLLVVFLVVSFVNDTAQQNLVCSPAAPISWSKDVKPLILSRCATGECHAATSSSQLQLGTYQQVKASSSDVHAQVANKTMPRSGSLTAREILLITCWIDQGMPEN